MTTDPRDTAPPWHGPPGVDLFAAATFLPVPFLALGCLFGSVWGWIGLGWIAVGMPVLDRVIRRPAPDAPEGTAFADADGLSVALAITHFALLLLAVMAVAGVTGLSWGDRIVLFLGCGMFFGQVSNSNAHELIHRSDRRLFRLGLWVYVSLLYGQHVSAHRLVHHRLVGTRGDPNTAVLGESYWAFLRQVWPGEFRAGLAAERARRPGQPVWRNPYALYAGGAVAIAAGVWILFGLAGVIAWIALAVYAQMQILLADYVQHYGLERHRIGGRLEPVRDWHSWDAPDPVSALWMLNAPRHSDHHAQPSRAYPALRLGDLAAPGRPVLPHSLPVMATIALSPRLWHRMMDRRVRRVRARQAASRERGFPASAP